MVCDDRFLSGRTPIFTYSNDARQCRSWIDHFVVSADVYNNIGSAAVMYSCVNLSDHWPIFMKVNLQSVGKSAYREGNVCTDYRKVLTRLRWDKADSRCYYDLTRTMLESVAFTNDIDANYDKILTALHGSARMCAPETKLSFFKHYWDDELNDMKYRSIEANKLWDECGRPRSGPVYHEWRSARYTYKRAFRNKQREANLYVSNTLNDCLMNKDVNEFWNTWNSKNNMKTCLPQCIDGVTDSAEVAKIFAGLFDEACQPNSMLHYNRLCDMFNVRFRSYNHVNISNRSATAVMVRIVLVS